MSTTTKRTDPEKKSGPALSELQSYLADFLAYLEFERGASRNTLSAYRADILQFGAFVTENGYDLKKLGPKEMSQYMDHLATTGGGGATTISRKMASLRSFFKHLEREVVALLVDRLQTAAREHADHADREQERGKRERFGEHQRALLLRPSTTAPAIAISAMKIGCANIMRQWTKKLSMSRG